MARLTIRSRQRYLKELGFYTGLIDGIEGNKTKAAYKALQNEYFTRKEDIDGIYGNDTDILLKNAYNVAKYTKNFKLSEFKCKCGGKYCTGYPAELSINLLKAVQAIRDKYGAITISSGMRCKQYNATPRVGGAYNSRHIYGKALDIVCSKSATVAGRKEIMSFFKQQKGCRYTYCNINGNYPNMGNAVHIDVN